VRERESPFIILQFREHHRKCEPPECELASEFFIKERETFRGGQPEGVKSGQWQLRSRPREGGSPI